MRKLQLIVVSVAIFGLAHLSVAAENNPQSNQSTLQQADVKPRGSDRMDTDQEITNKKLRAELGSKSKWSIKSLISYQGGSVEKPLAEDRPDYRSVSSARPDTYTYMNLAVKYRATDRDNINFGTGITVFKLFHRTAREASTKKGDEKSDGNFNISNPYVEYNRPYKVGDWQMASSAILTAYTESYDTDVKKGLGTLGIGQTIIQDFGKLSAGVVLSLGAYVYTDTEDTYMSSPGRRTGKPEYLLGVYPTAEYSFTDKLSLRTVFGYFNYDKRKTSNSFARQVSYQSLGLGVSVTRDMYLYPNVQFVPDDIRADRTNVGLTANINVF